jgi:hypothetical protein
VDITLIIMRLSIIKSSKDKNSSPLKLEAMMAKVK